MNKISVTGRVVADSEIRYTPGGDAILQIRLADDVGYGEKKTTNWWNCSLFGKRAEGLAPHLTKGQQVVVFGTAQMRDWTNKDGIKQISPDIRIDEIQLVGGKSEGQQPKQQSQQNRPAPNMDESDIPF